MKSLRSAAAALVVLLSVLLAAGTAGAAPSRADAATAVNVRFTVFPGAFPSLGVYIADALGFFKQNGIDVNYVNVGTGSSALQVLVGGDTDFTISDITGVALARKNAGADVVFVSSQFGRFMAALACRTDSGISGRYPAVMRQLEGKRIGITAPGSATDTYVRYTMIAAGANPNRANIIGVGGVPNLIAALQAGSVDCITAYQPIQALMAGRMRVVLNWATGQGPQIFARDYLFNGIVTTRRYAENNPGVVRRVAAAMQRATKYGSDPKNADKIARAVARFFPGLDVGTFAATVRDTAPTFGYQVTRTSVANALKVYNTIRPDDRVTYNLSSFVARTMRDITGPTVIVQKPTVRGKRVTLRWRGVDRVGPADVYDIPTGVASYDLAIRVGAQWKVRLNHSKKTSYAVRTTGNRLEYRLRARDRAGNTGAWKAYSVKGD